MDGTARPAHHSDIVGLFHTSLDEQFKEEDDERKGKMEKKTKLLIKKGKKNGGSM